MMKAKVFKNKRNGQFSVVLPKKEMNNIDKEDPKFIIFKKMRFIK